MAQHPRLAGLLALCLTGLSPEAFAQSTHTASVSAPATETSSVAVPQPPPETPPPAQASVVEPEQGLLPPGEAERMAAHPVGPGNISFRPGKGLVVKSDDGDFKLATRVRGQLRYTVEEPGSDQALKQQLRIRRARVVFAGHWFGAKNVFKMELAVSPNDVGFSDNLSLDLKDRIPTRSPLLDLYFEFRQLRDLTLRVGQYKLPSNRTRVISSGNLQMVDRSIVNSEFTLDRDMGLDLRSKDLFGLGLFRYYAGASIGRGRDSQGFDDFGMNYFVRAEVLPLGMFNDYHESDLSRDPKPRLSIGAVYVYQDRNRGLRRITSKLPIDGGTTNYQIVMADAIYKQSGFSAQIEAALRLGKRNYGDFLGDPVAGIPAPRDGWGAMMQAGYLIPRMPLEVSARFGVVRALGDATETSLGDQNELGAAVSWYLGRHPFKLQVDGFRIWDDGFSSGRTQVRLQLQASL